MSHILLLSLLTFGLSGCGGTIPSSPSQETGAVEVVTPTATKRKKADEAPNREKILGAWTLPAEKAGTPVNLLYDFYKDGRVKIYHEFNGLAHTTLANYQIDDKQLITIYQRAGQEIRETDTILELTRDKLTLFDGRDQVEKTMIRR